MTQQRFQSQQQQAWGNYPATISNPGSSSLSSSNTTSPPSSTSSSYHHHHHHQNHTNSTSSSSGQRQYHQPQQQYHQPQQQYHQPQRQSPPTHHHYQMSSSSSSMSSGKEYSDQGGGSSGSDSMHRLHPCKCSQCDPNYYTIPLQLLHTGNVEYVCRDCQFATQAYHVVQQHEGATGHRRWYNFPQ